MSSYFSGKMIRQLRLRRKFCQHQLMPYGEHSEVTLSRIENEHQKPSKKNLEFYLSELGFNKETYFCPYLENQTFDMISIRNRIITAIDHEDILLVKKLIETIKSSIEFKKGINLQFVRNCELKISLIDNDITEQTINSIIDAIHITFPEFTEEDFSKEILIFEEPNLIYTLFCVYEVLGLVDKAIDGFSQLEKSIEVLPLDNCHKERILPGVALSKVKLLIKTEKFAQAINSIETQLKQL